MIIRFADRDFSGPYRPKDDIWWVDRLTKAQRVVIKELQDLKSAYELGIVKGKEICAITEEQLANLLSREKYYIDPSLVWTIVPDDEPRIVYDQVFVDTTKPFYAYRMGE